MPVNKNLLYSVENRTKKRHIVKSSISFHKISARSNTGYAPIPL